MKKFKMGVLGLGEGRSILSAVQQSEYWELGMMCDLNEDLCRQRSGEFHTGACYTTDYREMLANSQIDVIGIYTPDQLHAAHIRMALEAGKHVICTKPLMVDLEEAHALLEAQQKSGKLVFVGQSSRYFEPLRRQRADFDAGKHGELVTLEAHYISDSRWFLERDWSHSRGFSWMYNFMIHAVDLAAWYLPEIEEVYGMGSVSTNTRERGLELRDTLRFLMKNKDGKFASVTGAYTLPTLGSAVEQSISCTLRGTKGISRAGYPKLQYYTNFEPVQKTAHLQTFDEMHGYYFRFEAENHHAGEYQNYIEHFAKEVLAGRTPRPDLREGIRTLAVMEAMEESLEKRVPVKVQDILDRRGIDIEAGD